MKRGLLYCIALAVTCGLDIWFLSRYSMSFFLSTGLLLFLGLLLIGLAELCKPHFFSSLTNKNFKLLVVALFFTLTIAELLLRALKVNSTYVEQLGQTTYFSPYWNDKNFWYVYRPHDTINYSRKDFNYYRVTNSLGIPERPLNLKDTSSVKKILCLGDSFTEGMGTPADSSWPRLLELYLNKNSADSFMVYNAGICGSDPVFQQHLLNGKLSQTKWNTVIFCINETDLDDCKIKGGKERFDTPGQVVYRKAPLWENLYAASYLFRLIINNALHYNGLLLSEEEDRKFEKLAVDDIRNTMDEVAIELAQQQIRLLVVVHPLKGEATNRCFRNADMDSLLLAMRNIKPLNLLPYFASDTLLGRDLYWPNDGHFKPEGYDLMAKEISRILQQK